MPKIQKLSSHEAYKIAAGEIVEKPAHVVKELIENALDAGATHIQIYIKRGGKELIRVVDNGSGMDAEDAQQCFEHHATSKIRVMDDLEALNTFGFRGEALSAIASISRITLITKTADDLAGTQVILYGGTVEQVQSIHARTGTDISVEHLLYNVPARKKFLKTDETHWRQIVKLFHAFVLCYPSIHFDLYSHDIAHFQCPKVLDPANRFTQLFDNHMRQCMLPLESVQENGIQIEGFISHIHHSRYDRTNIFIYINNRWIKNNMLIRAVILGYEGILKPNTFPSATLHIQVRQADLDVNTHPRKEEVQYRYEHQLARAIKTSVKKTLQKRATQELQTGPRETSGYITPSAHITPAIPENSLHIRHEQHIPTPADSDTWATRPPRAIIPMQEITQNSPVVPATFTQHRTFEQARPSIIGQYEQTYILLTHADGLLIIDQHAAHERILFERLQMEQEIITVPLIFPLQISFSAEEYALLYEHMNILHTLGILCEPFGTSAFCIREIPLYAQDISLQEVLQEFIQYVKNYKSDTSEVFSDYLHHKLYALIACKNSVRAGDVLPREKMQEIVEALQKSKSPQQCPHGRPTYWLIEKTEITKEFKRDYKPSRLLLW